MANGRKDQCVWRLALGQTSFVDGSLQMAATTGARGRARSMRMRAEDLADLHCSVQWLVWQSGTRFMPLLQQFGFRLFSEAPCGGRRFCEFTSRADALSRQQSYRPKRRPLLDSTFGCSAMSAFSQCDVRATQVTAARLFRLRAPVAPRSRHFEQP